MGLEFFSEKNSDVAALIDSMLLTYWTTKSLIKFIEPNKQGIMMQQLTSNNPGPEQLVAGFELALVQVDGQRQDRVALVAGVGVRQDGGVKLAQGERDVVEKPNAQVACCHALKR